MAKRPRKCLPKTQLLIRGLPDPIRRRLEKMAEQDGRALSPWIRKLLADVAERGTVR